MSSTLEKHKEGKKLMLHSVELKEKRLDCWVTKEHKKLRDFSPFSCSLEHFWERFMVLRELFFFFILFAKTLDLCSTPPTCYMREHKEILNSEQAENYAKEPKKGEQKTKSTGRILTQKSFSFILSSLNQEMLPFFKILNSASKNTFNFLFSTCKSWNFHFHNM